MAEDWRLTVVLPESAQVAELVGALAAGTGDHELRGEVGEQVAVSGSGHRLLLYTESESGARAAQRVISGMLGTGSSEAAFAVDRWHPVEEEWEEAGVPLPDTPEARNAERRRLEEQDAKESRETGLAEWEVRVELASHRDARAFAERLEQEGYTHLVRRWKYLLVGSATEEEAHAVAARIQADLPSGATIAVEPGGGPVWRSIGPNPFSVLGGLGG